MLRFVLLTRDQNAIGCREDLLDIIQGLGTFDLGDDPGFATGLFDPRLRLLDVRGITRKRYRNIVGTDINGMPDIGLTLGSQMVLTLKTPYRDGTTHIVMSPLVERWSRTEQVMKLSEAEALARSQEVVSERQQAAQLEVARTTWQYGRERQGATEAPERGWRCYIGS
jgi:hypothetical protein